jgi:hypothetical protein
MLEAKRFGLEPHHLKRVGPELRTRRDKRDELPDVVARF